jgi:hypothetical protein
MHLPPSCSSAYIFPIERLSQPAPNYVQLLVCVHLVAAGFSKHGLVNHVCATFFDEERKIRVAASSTIHFLLSCEWWYLIDNVLLQSVSARCNPSGLEAAIQRQFKRMLLT